MARGGRAVTEASRAVVWESRCCGKRVFYVVDVYPFVSTAACPLLNYRIC